MNTKSLLGASVLIMIGLLGLGLFVYLGINNYASKDKYVSVKGLSEREVVADQVIWPIVYTQVGNDMLALYSDVEAKNQIILKFLKDNGISNEEITVAPSQVSDREVDRWNQDEIPYRFQIKSIITVYSNQVEKVRELISRQDELLKAGITVGRDWEHQIVYSFNALNDIKPEMIEDATRNAHQVAEKFAEDSQSKLGGIRTASQGQFSIVDRDENTPFIKKVRVVTTVEYSLK